MLGACASMLCACVVWPTLCDADDAVAPRGACGVCLVLFPGDADTVG